MESPQVTIAIPTLNRAGLLRLSLGSALAQDYRNLDVVVLDNSSTDDTESTVKACDDDRLRYVRHDSNIGLLRNFNYAVEHNTSDYLVILQDDDILDRRFVSASVDALESHPTACLAFTNTIEIDEHGDPVATQVDNFEFPGGLVDGHHYLEQVVTGRNLVIHVSNAMLRASALDAVGPFDAPHSTITINSNLYFRLAADHNFAFVPEPLAQVRKHPDADHLSRDTDTAPLAMLAERADAAIHLLGTNYADDPAKRAWLTERMLHLSMRRSEVSGVLIADLTLSTDEKCAMASGELTRATIADRPIVVADDAHFGANLAPDRHLLPFLERDGYYWGPPDSSEQAIAEVERMRTEGAGYFCFAWPAFWSYDYYDGFRDHMLERYRRLLSNSRLILFDLQDSGPNSRRS